MTSTPIELLDDARCMALEASLVDLIDRFNAESTGLFDGRLIGGSMRSESGELIGGFSGHTWGRVCVLTHLWVSEAHRGAGIGRALLDSAEAEAIRRQCLYSILTTHDFQAPRFYERAGYSMVGVVDDWPVGHTNIVLRKRLADNSAPPATGVRMTAAMTQDQLKALVGAAAIAYVEGGLVGVGTGTTVNCFIDELAKIKDRISGAVSSSVASSERLRAHGIKVFDANEVESLPVYVDGADEIDHQGFMIKGGGAALTREKIVADLSQRFVCIADESKLVTTLGRFPLPIEVIPMAAAQVIRRLQAIGATATQRPNVVTDNGNVIVDARGLSIGDPLAMETELNQWPGVVTVGIFARHKASVCLLGTPQGVRSLSF